MDILISGASIAGPALAHWLGRYGFGVTVVEAAPALRDGGNAVDFRGPLHLGILRDMGVLDALREVRTGGLAMRFVSGTGRTLMEWPAALAGGDLEVLRGDLARILAASGDATYLFGRRITAMDDTPAGVDVTFSDGRQQRFDLVIGADGVHSGVRDLAFGSSFVRHLGYYVAGWSIPNDYDLVPDLQMINSPGRMMGARADHRDPARAAAFCAFRSPQLPRPAEDRDAWRRTVLRDRFAGLGWLTPQLLDHLGTTDDLWFDQICRVDVPTWHRGRIALVGDAACGATIGGQGTGTALVCAYVLAGELAAAGGDHRAAFPRYQERVSAFARGTQKGGDTTGMFLAPKSSTGIALRNYVNSRPWFVSLMVKIAADRSTALTLPDYPALARAAGNR